MLFIASFKGDEFSQDNSVFYMSAAVVAITLVAFVSAVLLKFDYPNHHLLLHAPLFLTLYLVVLYGIPGIMGFLNPKLLMSTHERVTIDYVYGAAGWIIILIGVFWLWFGYRVGLIGIKKNPSQELPLPRLEPVLILWLLTVVLRLISAALEGTGWGLDTSGRGLFLSLFNNTINYILSARYLVVVILTALTLRQRSPQWILICVLLIEVVYGLITAFTSQIWFVLVTYIMSYFYYGKGFRLTPPRIWGGGVLVFILVISTPIAERLRVTMYDTRSISGIIGGVQEATYFTWGQGVDYGIEIFQTRIFGRQASLAQVPGIIFRKTPSQIAYLGLDEFLALPTYLLPRFLWQAKPILSNGVWLSITYLNYPETTNSSSAPTIFGDAYMFSGELTLVVGMFVFGVVLAIIYRITVNRGLPFLCLSVVYAYIHIERQLTTILVGTIQATFVMFIIYFVLTVTDVKDPSLPITRPPTGTPQ